jgi:hypothetical protein
MPIDVLEEHAASIFTAVSTAIFQVCSLLGLFFDHEDEGKMFLRNVN